MSIHSFIDNVAISLGAIFIPKYFRNSIDTLNFKEHFKGIEIEFPIINGENDYEFIASTLSGKINGGFRLAQWLGKDYPTIIYHHGASEIPFDYGFKRIFPYKHQEIKANLFVVRAPFHSSRKDFDEGLAIMSNFVLMLAVSVRLIEHLIKYIKENNSMKILVAGSSLGGFVTNLHHINYNSADIYTPLLAGTLMSDVFLNSVYSKSVALRAKNNPRYLESVFNFQEDFAAQDNRNVFPLLGRFDTIIRYDIQKSSYSNCKITTIDKGHTTGALAFKDLRKHILNNLLQ